MSSTIAGTVITGAPVGDHHTTAPVAGFSAYSVPLGSCAPKARIPLPRTGADLVPGVGAVHTGVPAKTQADAPVTTSRATTTSRLAVVFPAVNNANTWLSETARLRGTLRATLCGIEDVCTTLIRTDQPVRKLASSSTTLYALSCGPDGGPVVSKSAMYTNPLASTAEAPPRAPFAGRVHTSPRSSGGA